MRSETPQTVAGCRHLTNRVQQMPTAAAPAILRRPAVERLTGLSYSSIYRQMRAGRFPGRVRLGPKSVGWKEAEVLNWIATREPVTATVTAP